MDKPGGSLVRVLDPKDGFSGIDQIDVSPLQLTQEVFAQPTPDASRATNHDET